MNYPFYILLIFSLAASSAVAANTTVKQLLENYRQQGANNFDSKAGEKLWSQSFKDAAELEPEVQQKLTEYLILHSAERSDYRRSKRIMRSINKGDAPIRITELSYFIHEHDEIPQRMIKGNDKVGSLSNCDACHRRAEQGFFSEREINIPGYGARDD